MERDIDISPNSARHFGCGFLATLDGLEIGFYTTRECDCYGFSTRSTETIWFANKEVVTKIGSVWNAHGSFFFFAFEETTQFNPESVAVENKRKQRERERESARSNTEPFLAESIAHTHTQSRFRPRSAVQSISIR